MFKRLLTLLSAIIVAYLRKHVTIFLSNVVLEFIKGNVNGEVILCLIKHSEMKTYRGVPTFTTQHWMEMSGQTESRVDMENSDILNVFYSTQRTVISTNGFVDKNDSVKLWTSITLTRRQQQW
jgi:hypothetical protein